MPALWPHQLSGLKKVNRALERHRSVIGCSPCGSGKTVMMTADAQESLALGRRVMFLAPRVELIAQICRKLDEWLPCSYGLITARTKESAGLDLYNQVQVASVDTLVSRVVKRQNLVAPLCERIYLDEAHLYITPLRMALLDLFPKAQLIGWTATPARPSGRALNMTYQELVEITTPAELIEGGYLVKPSYMSPSRVDRDKLRSMGDDFDKESAGEAVMPLIGDIVEHWLDLGADRRTACFLPTIKHSLYMRNQFIEAGVSCEHVDSKMDPEERDRAMGRFARGETQMLCNVGLLEYGIDIPAISCVIDASPTKSVVRYIQRGGRGMRTAPDKHDLLYLDHAGNVHEHGYLEDDRFWTLQGLQAKPKKPRESKKKRSSETPRQLTCPECFTIFRGSLTCACGYHFEELAREFQVVEGKLVPFTTADAEKNIFIRVRFYCELLQYQADKGYRDGWARHTYKERFGKSPQPRWDGFVPMPPSPETLRYIRYRNIKRAKQREAAERRQQQRRSQ